MKVDDEAEHPRLVSCHGHCRTAAPPRPRPMSAAVQPAPSDATGGQHSRGDRRTTRREKVATCSRYLLGNAVGDVDARADAVGAHGRRVGRDRHAALAAQARVEVEGRGEERDAQYDEPALPIHPINPANSAALTWSGRAWPPPAPRSAGMCRHGPAAAAS